MVDFFSDSGKTPDGGGRRGNAEIMRAGGEKGTEISKASKK